MLSRCMSSLLSFIFCFLYSSMWYSSGLWLGSMMSLFRYFFLFLILLNAAPCTSALPNAFVQLKDAQGKRFYASVGLIILAAAADIGIQENKALDYRSPLQTISTLHRIKGVLKAIGDYKKWLELAAQCKAALRSVSPSKQVRALGLSDASVHSFSREHKLLTSAFIVASANAVVAVV